MLNDLNMGVLGKGRDLEPRFSQNLEREVQNMLERVQAFEVFRRG